MFSLLWLLCHQSSPEGSQRGSPEGSQVEKKRCEKSLQITTNSCLNKSRVKSQAFCNESVMVRAYLLDATVRTFVSSRPNARTRPSFYRCPKETHKQNRRRLRPEKITCQKSGVLQWISDGASLFTRRHASHFRLVEAKHSHMNGHLHIPCKITRKCLAKSVSQNLRQQKSGPASSSLYWSQT